MIVVDVPNGSSLQRVAAMGSCRLTRPLLQRSVSGEISFVWSQLWLTHTTADVLQGLDLIRTATRPPPLFEPLVLDPSERRSPPGDPAEFMKSIDTFLVEICGLHLLQAGGWSIQVDRLATTLLSDHAEILLPWWNEVCFYGRPTPGMVQRVLAQLADKGVDLSDDLLVVLRDIVRTRQGQDDVRAGMEALISAYPGRWIFVSHFAVPAVESTVMTQRRELSRLLRNVANSAGAEFFDPSDLITAAGRRAALGSGGNDVYHYAVEFEPVVGTALMNILRHGNPKPARPPPLSAPSREGGGMMVFDLLCGHALQRVAAIGSRRIGATLEHICSAGPIHRVLTGLAGATTAGAAQLLNLLQRGETPPPFFKSLIYPTDGWTPPAGDPAAFLKTIDTFLVEISDGQILQVGPWTLQADLFDAFVSTHPEMSPWWKEVREYGWPREATIRQVSQAFAESGVEAPAEMELLLRAFMLTTQREDDLRNAVSELVRKFPGRWIFVSHFTLPDVDSTLMNQRRDFARALRDAAEAAGAEFFDPSDLVAATGRDRALAANGGELHHYSADFERLMADAYLDLICGGSLQRSPDSADPAFSAGAWSDRRRAGAGPQPHRRRTVTGSRAVAAGNPADRPRPPPR